MTPRHHFEHMQAKPESYFGRADYPFTRLIAWFFGYIHGHGGATQEGGLSPSELIPDDFKEFVAQRLGHDFATDHRQWWSYIMAHTSSEPEALAMFFKLRAEYDGQQQVKRQ